MGLCCISVCLHQAGFSADISILTWNTERRDIDRRTIWEIKKQTGRVTRWQTGGYKNIFPVFRRTVNSETSPATCKTVVLRQRHYSVSLYQYQTGTFLLISILVTTAFCLSGLSLDTGHCTSSFISRLFSNLSSHRSETHFFRLSICPNSSVWLSVSLFVSPPMCHSFPFCTVILLPISGATQSLLLLLISLICLFQACLLSAFSSQSILCCFYPALFLDPFPPHPFRFSRCHFGCWVSIDIPN